MDKPEDTSPDDRELFGALAVIDVRLWGRARVSLVCQVHQGAQRWPDGWARLSYRALARASGCSEWWVWDLVGPAGRLWKSERVLRRVAGRRGRATRLQVADPARWRGVPWTGGTAHLPRSTTAASAVNLPRSSTAASGFDLPRSTTAASAAELAALDHRGKSVAPAPPEAPPEAMPWVLDSKPLSSAGVTALVTPGQAERERIDQETEKLTAALRARCAPGSAWYVNGLLTARLRDRLLAGDDPATLARLIAAAPAQLGPPAVVDWLGSTGPAVAMPAAPRRRIEVDDDGFARWVEA